MDPKLYDELLEQEDHFRAKYHVEIFLEHTKAPDTIYSSNRQIHAAVMTISGERPIFQRAPAFRSDSSSAFYRQTDAMANARIKLVAWFKVSCCYYDLSRSFHWDVPKRHAVGHVLT